MTGTNDKLLLSRAYQFEAQALTEIYDCYSPGIYRYAMRLLGDTELAKDCMAETFSRFLAALRHGVGPGDCLQAYLYRIGHNWITDYYRRPLPPSAPLDVDLCSDPEDDPAEIVAGAMKSHQLRAAFVLLTAEQRQVVTLKYLEDWSNEEIARAMNKPVGAVKSLQHRALEALRQHLHLAED